MEKVAEAYLSTAYFGNIQYFSKFILANKLFIEQHESYQKQSYRNRCVIMSANGSLSLVIPIEKKHGQKMPIRDVAIDYSERWQQVHWRAICSAYSSSPFFEYYADELHPLYEQQQRFLFDFNWQLTELMLELLQVKANVQLTGSYNTKLPSTAIDYRQSINPKSRLAKPDELFSPKPYFQVFAQRFGFVQNLSIIDLLFNEGPNASLLLKSSIPQV